MFNVIRTYPAPDSIAKNQHNKEDILEALLPIFFEKCYLCERDEIQDAEVEHFVPHEGDKLLKYAWENLYYACSRCNSIKSNSHIDLLDCADPTVDVGGLISCLMPSVPNGNIIVEPVSQNPTTRTNNTVDLLNYCYNLENTALRKISRESLFEKMWDYYSKLLLARQVLRNKSSGKTAKKEAEEIIESMMDVKHPFSIFWRYFYINDSFLVKNYPYLRSGF
ncbi:HNH endonuclease [Aliamphritea hakodatensis]|uniref:HNH endonuclease n=1 Tax=Aliamphritea hakodatensis TaxID=2895352 RepID=UPI0022FD5FD0|nr:HNH endonuclease [Aliamphritea hakodatensis]